MPMSRSIDYIAYIISWNIWQMDGLKMVTPGSCEKVVTTDMFGEETSVKCVACEKGELIGHIGIPCVVKVWGKDKDKQQIQFSTLVNK